MLVASMCLLESADGLSGLVACAPHLERIDLSTGETRRPLSSECLSRETWGSQLIMYEHSSTAVSCRPAQRGAWTAPPVARGVPSKSRQIYLLMGAAELLRVCLAASVHACLFWLSALVRLPATTTDGEHEDDTDHTLQLDGEEGPYVHQIGILGGLSRLTQLDLNMEGRRIYHCYWRALARLTDLKSLDLTQANYKYLGGVVTLTTCQQLTYLCVDDGDSWPCLALEVSCMLLTPAPLLCARQLRLAEQVPLAIVCVLCATACVSKHQPGQGQHTCTAPWKSCSSHMWAWLHSCCPP